jgi:hypothetical protein
VEPMIHIEMVDLGRDSTKRSDDSSLLIAKMVIAFACELCYPNSSKVSAYQALGLS